MRNKVIFFLVLFLITLTGCSNNNPTILPSSESTYSTETFVAEENLPYTIYLSPSTQAHNSYADNLGTEEENMKALAVSLKSLLVERGFTVISNDSMTAGLTLSEAVQESNSYNVDLHISLHSNASVNHQSGGLEIWYKDAKDKTIASLVYNELIEIIPSIYDSRGIKSTNELYELNVSTAPACLIELLFHDESSQAQWIVNNTDLSAKCIYNAICKYFALV